ncbi:MAG: hypothetical protein C5B52_04730 [Bacteroidetes bacterium]|nr:MAG: hypothetical protein C5B52_04730 [Bacteroidota bacterium]
MTQKFLFFSILFLSIFSGVNSQNIQVIPACTGYAVPIEGYTANGESDMFFPNHGLSGWSSLHQQIEYYFYVVTPGKADLFFTARADVQGNQIQAICNNHKMNATMPVGKAFKEVKIGSVEFKDPGYYKLLIKGLKKNSVNITEIQSIKFAGEATQGMHFNKDCRRNAASVHLKYPVADTSKLVAFYNEVTIPAGSDLVNSYFMACGFKRGYFGMQVNSNIERRIIFSVWDAGTESFDRNKVNSENKVSLIAKGEQVFAGDFGNEGTGGHSHWVYDWKSDETYRFLITAAPDSANGTTIYAGYFFVPESQKWKLIATFKAPKDGEYLHGLYSFVEDFDGANGQGYRKALFSNQWVRDDNHGWKEITECNFSTDATGRSGERTDFGGGTEGENFYLWNGGFTQSDAKYGDIFRRNPQNKKPTIDFSRNVDSAITADKEKAQLKQALKSGLIDTTGSVGGVYYKIVKEGDGSYPELPDTVVVHYKGSLLSNGSVFDQTKAEPASFPLNRLIKGWQQGIPKCRKGGTIRLIIPSSLAYSIRSLDVIPPNSILVFDVTLVDIKKEIPKGNSDPARN